MFLNRELFSMMIMDADNDDRKDDQQTSKQGRKSRYLMQDEIGKDNRGNHFKIWKDGHISDRDFSQSREIEIEPQYADKQAKNCRDSNLMDARGRSIKNEKRGKYDDADQRLIENHLRVVCMAHEILLPVSLSGADDGRNHDEEESYQRQRFRPKTLMRDGDHDSCQTQ